MDLRKLATLAGDTPVKRNMKGNTLFVAVGGLIIAGGILLGLYWSYSSASSSESDNALASQVAVGGNEVPAQAVPVIVSRASSQSNLSPKFTRNEDISRKVQVSDTVVNKFDEPEALESVTRNTVAKSETFFDSSSEIGIEEFEAKPNVQSSSMENEDTNAVFESNVVRSSSSLKNIEPAITAIHVVSDASNTRESSVTSEETKAFSSEEASIEAVSLAFSSLSDDSDGFTESLPSNNEFFILEQSKKDPTMVKLLYSNAESEITDLVKLKNVFGTPKVSPDGRQMCFCRKNEIPVGKKLKIKIEIVSLNLENPDLEPDVIVTDVHKCDFNFTPSSDAIIIPKDNEIVKVNLFGYHSETTIFTSPLGKRISHPTYSYDGSILYFIQGLKVYQKLPDQENPVHLLNVVSGNLPDSFEISSDNKRFIFKYDNFHENKIEVVHVDGDNAECKTISVPDEKIKEAFFSKDGQTVYIRTIASDSLNARLHKLGPEDRAPKLAHLPFGLQFDQVHSIILK